ncbi:MAG: hypothetical protein SPL08_03190 [Pseudomonadota bacterium]|nr:hypothetical protein [Pseudomonadota bacterium]
MTDKVLKASDFKSAEVFDCGLDNRDPQRGYRKSHPVQGTEIAKLLDGNSASFPTQDLGKER